MDAIRLYRIAALDMAYTETMKSEVRWHVVAKESRSTSPTKQFSRFCSCCNENEVMHADYRRATNAHYTLDGYG